MHRLALVARQLQRADAFDRDLAALALHVAHASQSRCRALNDPPSCGRSRLTRNWWLRAAGLPTVRMSSAVAPARSISSELPEMPVTS